MNPVNVPNDNLLRLKDNAIKRVLEVHKIEDVIQLQTVILKDLFSIRTFENVKRENPSGFLASIELSLYREREKR